MWDTYWGDYEVYEQRLVVDKDWPTDWGACHVRLTRTGRLMHLLEVFTDVETALERARVSVVGRRINLVGDCRVFRYVLGKVA